MISLGLLGRNIQHSKSQHVYEKLLGRSIKYQLFDIENLSDIPNIDWFFTKVDGLSITAPYKENFLDKINLDKSAEIVQSVNCIKFDLETSKYIGFNTDYMACDVILKNIIDQKFSSFVVTGNGPMARVVIDILKTHSITYNHVYRSNNFQINNFDVGQIVPNSVVVNCCSRGVVFKPNGLETKIKLFWDLNYGQDGLYSDLADHHVRYINGMELLELQAKFALQIWNIK